MKKKKLLVILLTLTFLMGIAATSCSNSNTKTNKNSKNHSSKSDDDEDDDEDNKDAEEDNDNSKKDKKDKDSKDDSNAASNSSDSNTNSNSSADNPEPIQDATTRQPKTCEEAMEEYMQYALEGDFKTAASLTNEKIYNIYELSYDLEDDQAKIAEYLITTSTYTISEFEYDEDEASCYLNLTFKDYESLYERFNAEHIKWTFDEFYTELVNSEETSYEEINFELIQSQEDADWVIISDFELYDFFYDILEPFEVPDVYEYIPKEFNALFEESFTSDKAMSLINNSEMGYVLTKMFDSDNARADFMKEYIDHINYDWSLNYVDKDSETAGFTISTLIPDTNELINIVNHNRDIAVAKFAYSYAGEDYATEAQLVLSNMTKDAYIKALSDCSIKSKTIEVTMSFKDVDNAKIPTEFGNSLFLDLIENNTPAFTDDEYIRIRIDASDYALSNNLIDQATHDAIQQELLPQIESATPSSTYLYVDDEVFYADTSILGMSFDDVNALFGNDFPEPQIWEWGTYDTYFDYIYNGNQYTFFLIGNTVTAVRYEIEAGVIPRDITDAYCNMYSTTRLGDGKDPYVPGTQGAGFRCITEFGYIDVFMNIYDDIKHVAMHYSI